MHAPGDEKARFHIQRDESVRVVDYAAAAAMPNSGSVSIEDAATTLTHIQAHAQSETQAQAQSFIPTATGEMCELNFSNRWIPAMVTCVHPLFCEVRFKFQGHLQHRKIHVQKQSKLLRPLSKRGRSGSGNLLTVEEEDVQERIV